MRYDAWIYFVKELPGAYNEQTGDYDDGGTREEYRLANITDASEERMQLVYGRIRQGALVIRIQGEDPEPFDYIRIGTRRYQVDRTRKLCLGRSYTVSEVQ